ncbi:pilin|uniref:Pilus assembly protein Flp/PilA n=1 Tax=Dendrosporobacter quercicolus TaxID=146817 RepID=A0A1H0A4X9_9FIRM|nr:hypothetical protein [Dendrosporobacter quercicolus]NSL49993.1 pilin [Dendrosporobacter quercicolus DSM 1736]SDN27786.1 pilus assembly protein Flp/PilA [Dendrosporobacter quercicolus]
MLKVWKRLRLGRLNQKGQGMVEYAVVLAIVAAIGVTLVNGNTSLRERVSNLYIDVTNDLQTIRSRL